MTAPIKLMYDPDEPRTCRACGTTRPADDFEKSFGKIVMGYRRVYLRRICKKCRGAGKLAVIPVPRKPKTPRVIRLVLLEPDGYPIYNPQWGWSP